jgi:hypothetical protein
VIAPDGSVTQDVDLTSNVPPPSAAQPAARSIEARDAPPKAGDKQAPNRKHPPAR